MSSLYGNIISHIPRSQFEISKIYQSRLDMEANILNDGIALYQYVLVKYGEPGEGYSSNLQKDQNEYGQVNGGRDYIVNYDQTVWQKQYSNIENKYYYRAIDRLHSILPTFQDMSARSLIIEGDNSLSYEAFGTAYLYGYYSSYDQESADVFNKRYPESEIQIQVDENGIWNKEQVQTSIENKIEELNSEIDAKNEIINIQSTNIDNNQSILNNYYENVVEQYNNLVSTYSNLTIPNNSNIINNINNNITNINSNLESIEEKQSALYELYNTLNDDQKVTLNTYKNNLIERITVLKTYEEVLNEQLTLLSEIQPPDSARHYLENLKANFISIINDLLTTSNNYLSELTTNLNSINDLTDSLLVIANKNLLAEEATTVNLAQTIISYISDENNLQSQITSAKNNLSQTIITEGQIKNNVDQLDSDLEDEIINATTEELSLTLKISEISSTIGDMKDAANSDITQLETAANEITALLDNILDNISDSITLIDEINRLYYDNLSKETNTLELLDTYETNLNNYKNQLTEIYNLITKMFENIELDYDIFEIIFNYLEETQTLLSDYKNSMLELIDLEDSKSYYEEMLNWFNHFTANVTESFIYEMPEKVLSYGTNTIEYPMK